MLTKAVVSIAKYGSTITSLAIMLLVFVAAVEAQPVKVRVKGGDKAFRAQVVALLTDPSAPRASGGADAEIDLQKTGGARTKCGSAWTFLPGPTAAEIVAQFRAWLPGAMESRRAEKAARAEARARGLEALAVGLAAAGSASPAYTNRSEVPTGKLMLFGGPNHRTYLGCLNCSEYATDSVKNRFGRHGSGFSSDSIFNEFSSYGSAFSSHSACNPLASDPPVIVDDAGAFYGRLTINEIHSQRTRDAGLRGWIAGVCAGR